MKVCIKMKSIYQTIIRGIITVLGIVLLFLCVILALDELIPGTVEWLLEKLKISLSYEYELVVIITLIIILVLFGLIAISIKLEKEDKNANHFQ